MKTELHNINNAVSEMISMIWPKAELLQVGIFFLIHLFAWDILLLKKLEIEETKTT